MFWKKKKIIDLTQDKTKIPESMRARLEEGYKDLNHSAQTSTNSESALGFLSSLATASDSFSSSEAKEDLNLKHLKVKIEDVEYKLDSLSRQISKIIDRIDLAEKKIERTERRGVS